MTMFSELSSGVARDVGIPQSHYTILATGDDFFLTGN